MLDEIRMADRPHSVTMAVYVWFLRLMAISCFISGLIYWMQLLGMSGDGAMRFDLLEPRWRILTTVLAVILPSAALGLWMTQAWGVLLWVVSLSIEIAAFGVWANLYTDKPMLIIGHAIALGFWLLFVGALFLDRRKQRIAGL